jgi:hypothetical protein
MFNLQKAADAQRILSENKRIGSPFVNCVIVEKTNDIAQACAVKVTWDTVTLETRTTVDVLCGGAYTMQYTNSVRWYLKIELHSSRRF